MRKTLCILFLLTILASCAAAERVTVTLTFAGDCTLGGTEKARASDASFDSYIARFGYGYPFEKVKALFAEDDLTIVNLEGVLYDGTDGAAKKTYCLRGPESFAKILTEGSVEAVTVGNNHAGDFGQAGMDATARALENENIIWFGANEFARSVYIYEKQGVKIGFVGSYISYWWQNADVIKGCFQELEDAGCQLIIACMHGGVEYDKRRDIYMERMANGFLKLGADILIGHHPHAVQGMDVREGGRTVLYSLGNFSFGGNDTVRDKDALIARVTLTFEDGAYVGHQLTLIPALVSGTHPKNNYQPVLAAGEDAARILKAFQKDTKLKLNPFAEGVGAVQEFIPFE